VDPLSHAALGRTLAALVWGKTRIRPGSDRDQTSIRGPSRVTAAAVIGALSLDVDLAVSPFGWDRYLRVHEIGTHSAIGTIACGLLTATVVRFFTPAARWPALFLSAWLGAASHLLLDLVSSARSRVLWPFTEWQVSIPLVAMADPWLGAILIAALPTLWLTRRRHRILAAGILTIATAFLAVKGLRGVRAVDTYRAAPESSSVLSYNVEARWASLDEWYVFDRTDQHVRSWRIRADRLPQLILQWPVNAVDEAVAASQAFSAVRNLRHVHDFAFPVRFPRSAGGGRVLWSDIRFCWSGREPGVRQLEPVAVLGDQRMSCAFWAGVDFDRAGHPIAQIVRIAGFTQTRRPGD